MDLFDFEGNTWLVLVDKYSGYPFAQSLRSTTTAAVTSIINDWFLEYGFPVVIRSDNGPQFRSEFAAYCSKNNIKHQTASPYMPQSNGLAESAVKNVKHLLKKCVVTKEDFKNLLFAFRNMPRKDGLSPAQLFFGRKPRTHLPRFDLFDETCVDHDEIRSSTRRQVKEAFDRRARDLPSLQIGQRVLIQHPASKIWDDMGEVTEIHSLGRSYTIETDAGKTIRRNRRFLKPTSISAHASPESKPEDAPTLRRSERLKKSVSFEN